MFDRWEALIGKDNLDKIKSKQILLLGVGGVGGYIAEALIRSGIMHLTIIDGDKVGLSNLNRQVIALHSTIGKRKVEVMKERLEDISNDAVIEAIDKFLSPSDIETLNLEKYDYIIDAIDDVKVKVELIKYASLNNLNLIVSTGTAKKMDPSKLKISTLDKTSYDPLARSLRHNLKGYDLSKIVTVYSDEEPKVSDGVLGSSAFVPSSAGLLIASYVIRKIIE